MSERAGNTYPPFSLDFDPLASLLDINRVRGNDHIALLPPSSDGKARLLRWFPKPNSWDGIGSAYNRASAAASTTRVMELLQRRNAHHAILKTLGVRIIEHTDFIGQSLSVEDDEVVIYSLVPFLERVEPVHTRKDRRLLHTILTAYSQEAQDTCHEFLDVLEAGDYAMERERGQSYPLLLDTDPKLVTIIPDSIREARELIDNLRD